MASPIGFGDVVAALEICFWIKKNCFSQITNASILYGGLKEDVLNLEKRLKQFHASFETAITQIGGDQDRHALLKLEADELIGDFGLTLEDCKKLLRKHARFNGERAAALDNLFWHANTQPAVTELRSRLQSHHYKIFLFIEPLKFDLLSGIQADTREILAHLRREAGITNPVQLPEIPQALSIALEKALQRNAPGPIDEPRQIPLQDGIDAFSFHFRECTFQSDSIGISPDQQSNLSLLKAHWLYRTLESSEALNESRPGSLFRRVVEQLGHGVELQYKKRQIHAWPDDAFSDLDDTAFAIWHVKEIEKPPVLTDPSNLEEKLAEVPLVSHHRGEKQVLFIFRVNDNVLRIVESRCCLDDSIGPQMTERYVYLDEDRFIPIYAVALRDGKKGTINITHSKGAGLVAYDLQSRISVLKIQGAFTGYETVSYSLSVSCSISYKGMIRVSQDSGVGEVQFWQRPGTMDISCFPSSPAATIASSDCSEDTGSSYTIASRAFSGFDTRVVSVVSEDDSEMVVSQLPKPPLLVLLMRGKGEIFSIWQVDLSCLKLGTSRVFKNAAGLTYRSTLEARGLKKFPARRHIATKAQLDLWNLNSFQKSIQASSKNKDQRFPMVEQLDATSLDFDFSSKAEQDRFEGHFMVVSNVRAEQIKQFHAGRKVAALQAYKPTRSQSYSAWFRRDSADAMSESKVNGVSQSREAYVLEAIPRFSVIDLDDPDGIYE